MNENVAVFAVALVVFVQIVAIPLTIGAMLSWALRRIPPEHRHLTPGLVWLVLIPCFGTVWNFFVFPRVSRSLRDAYQAGGRADVGDCGYGLGIAYAACALAASVPIVICLAWPAAIVCLILYLFKVSGLASGIPPAIEGSAPAATPAPGITGAMIALAIGASLLIAVPALGIVAAIAVPNFLNAVDRGKQKRTMADLTAIGSALEGYKVEHDAYPSAVDLQSLETALKPDHIRAMPRMDGWGHPFVVDVRPEGYTLASRGKDGVAEGCEPGVTTSFDADICFVDGSFLRHPEGAQR